MIQMNLWDKVTKLKWNLLVVYGAAHDEYKMSFLAELSHFCANNNEPMIIGGDFNIIRYLKEKNTMDGVHRHIALFNSLIHFYELRELAMNGGLFTWSNNQDPPVLEKLDRILMTKEWEDIFPQVFVNKLTREVSDHNQLILATGKCDNLPHIQFKFDLSWLKNPEFFTLVEKIWNKPCRAKTTIDRIQQKLKLIKQFFKGWGFNLQGEMRKKRKDYKSELGLLESIEEDVGLSADQIDRKMWLLIENLKSLEQEEMYWYERSHETWLLKGDNNTSYFHKCANSRKRKNNIISLENDSQVIEGDENLLKHATEYYTDLFGPPVEYDREIWENTPRVSPYDNEFLCKPFTEKEIKDALDQMEKKTKLQDQTKSQLNFTKAIGILLRLILYNYLKIFITRKLIPVELTMG